MPPDSFTTISECTFAAIDFESAGSARGRTDHPIQVGISSWSQQGGWLEDWTSYIACDADITWSAQNVHGITLKDLKSAPQYSDLWPEIQNRLRGQVCVGHNIGTEKRFLSQFPGHNFSPWIDTLQLCRTAYPEARSHALGDLCDWLGVSAELKAKFPDKYWHDALFDAAASIALLKDLIHRFKLETKPLGQISSP